MTSSTAARSSTPAGGNLTRDSNLDTWTNGVWNQVFLSNNGAPPTDFGDQPASAAAAAQRVHDAGEHAGVTVGAVPLHRLETELPDVFVPAVQHDSVGPSWTGGAEAGQSIGIRRFFMAHIQHPGVGDQRRAAGQNLILTPGVYDLREPIVVRRPGTVVIGLRRDAHPANRNVAMKSPTSRDQAVQDHLRRGAARNACTAGGCAGGDHFFRSVIDLGRDQDTARRTRRSSRTCSSGSAGPTGQPRTA